MTIRSLIHDMRSRPHRVVHDTALSASGSGGSDRWCWSELPEELLREILMKAEAADGGGWPSRRSVVACAGVCRGWRQITKEIVSVPEISSKLTFPNSLKQPGPRDSLIQCFIKRDRTTQTYHLYLGLTNALTDDGKFLLAACKSKHATCTDYIISLHPHDMSRRSNAYVGKLRSNFLGTKFTVFDGQLPGAGAKMRKSRSSNLVNLKQVSPKAPSGSYPVAHVSYELNVWGARGPRRMRCIMDAIPARAVEPGGVAPTQAEFPVPSVDFSSSFPFSGSKSKSISSSSSSLSRGDSGLKDSALVLENKLPRWHEQLRCWCLNFHGRVTVASVKNFQLVAALEDGQSRSQPQNERIVLQFGKIGKDIFTMDYGYPISAFQAFAICLSSFETRIACE